MRVTTSSTGKLRRHMAHMLDRVRIGIDRVIITRHDKPIAMVISYDDRVLLEPPTTIGHQLTSQAINNALREIDSQWGINRPPAMRGVDKSIPYVGGYWRDIDWDRDTAGLADVRHAPGFPSAWGFAFLEPDNDKWGLELLRASEYDTKLIRHAAELAAIASNPYTIQGLFDVVQWAGLRAADRARGAERV